MLTVKGKRRTPVMLFIPKQSLTRHRQIIALFFGFRFLNQSDKEQLQNEIADLVQHGNRPPDIFRQITHNCRTRQIVSPGSHFWTALISREINRRQAVLNQIIKESLSDKQKLLLASLFEKESNDDGSPGSRSRLTLLKRPSQSLQPAHIKANLLDWQTLQSLYHELADVIIKLNLSGETLRYYAETVIKAELFQLSRQNDEARHLHLLAFFASQTFRYQDVLIDSFLQSVQTTVHSATTECKEKLFRERSAQRINLNGFLQSLRENLLNPLAAVEEILAVA